MIRNLIFEGGGVKGIAYGGALIALEEMGVLQNVRRVAGTSAGAITAVLLAVGYTAEDLSDIVAKTDFNQFADDTFGILRDTSRLLFDYGWHQGDHFLEWIGDLIAAKTGYPDTKFEDLASLHEALDLYLTATNISKQRVEIFSHEHTPCVEIRQAARMSMGIPLYFKCVRFGPEEDIMIDGGVSYNYPIDLFDKEKYVLGNLSECPVFNTETLGLRVDSTKEITLNGMLQGVPKEIRNLFDFTGSLLDFLQAQANKRHLGKKDYSRTIFIDTMDIGATDFDLEKEEIYALLTNGRIGVDQFFKRQPIEA